MPREYVQRRDGGYHFEGSRVSLDSVVYEFLRGESPEAIGQAFPSLTLEQVYGGITFYLANRLEVDSYLKNAEAQFEEMARESRAAHPLLYAKLDEAKRGTLQ